MVRPSQCVVACSVCELYHRYISCTPTEDEVAECREPRKRGDAVEVGLGREVLQLREATERGQRVEVAARADLQPLQSDQVRNRRNVRQSAAATEIERVERGEQGEATWQDELLQSRRSSQFSAA